MKLVGLQSRITEDAVRGNVKLQRGQVWCYECGRTMRVRSSTCLRQGWPTCCGYTMSLDSSAERKAGR